MGREEKRLTNQKARPLRAPMNECHVIFVMKTFFLLKIRTNEWPWDNDLTMGRITQVIG